MELGHVDRNNFLELVMRNLALRKLYKPSLKTITRENTKSNKAKSLF